MGLYSTDMLCNECCIVFKYSFLFRFNRVQLPQASGMICNSSEIGFGETQMIFEKFPPGHGKTKKQLE